MHSETWCLVLKKVPCTLLCKEQKRVAHTWYVMLYCTWIYSVKKCLSFSTTLPIIFPVTSCSQRNYQFILSLWACLILSCHQALVLVWCEHKVIALVLQLLYPIVVSKWWILKKANRSIAVITESYRYVDNTKTCINKNNRYFINLVLKLKWCQPFC